MPPVYLDGDDGRRDREAFLDGIDTFLIDCDGVVWMGPELLPGIKEAVKTLHAAKKRLLFVSNNSTKSRQDYMDKFAKLGLGDVVTKEEIFSSAYATAAYLTMCMDLPKDKRVYVVGMGGIRDELKEAGIRHATSDEDGVNLKRVDDMSTVLPDDSIGAVVVGFDIDINYKKLAKAFTYLYQRPEVPFLATNADLTFPAGERCYPGTGSIVYSISACTGRKPIIVGKPSQTLLEIIDKKYGGLDKSRTCMIGDRLDTDIAFGLGGGIKTLLVMTGVSALDELQASSVQPHFVINSLAGLGPTRSRIAS